MPEAQENQQRFYEYARKFIRAYVPQLTRLDILNFDEWLARTPYSQARKDYLANVRDELTHADKKICDSKSFIKDESYGEPKNPRLINSPSDESKTILGPLQKAMDEKMFHDPIMSRWFIKGTDPRTWIDRMEETFHSEKVINTDFSSFECHHRGVFAKVIWFWQMHMSRNIFVSRCHKRMISRLIRGTNHSKLSKCTSDIDETLMSGVPWTSSANGILNLIINSYLAMNHKYPTQNVDFLVREALTFRGLFEGDDGLFEDVGQTEKAARDLGVKLDLIRCRDYSFASFCSMVAPRGETSLCYDFRKAFTNFTMLPAKYKDASETKCMALIRAKAMSYKYMYGNSPIVGAMAYKLLEMTKSIDYRPALDVLDERKRELVAKAADSKCAKEVPEISAYSRHIYSAVFGISAEDQIELEETIMTANSFPIRCDLQKFYKTRDIVLSSTHCNSWPEPELYPTKPPPPIAAIIADGALRGRTRSRCSRIDSAFDPLSIAPTYNR
jgi:hypothetical protein